ncbi:MAG: NfeD family protein [Thermoleophilaceae bacterium]|nr:NfeD family protein [Thermoleophilaceae bacterium]
MEDWVYWMILAVLMAAAELAVFSVFIFGPLALAAVITAIVAATGAGMEVQLTVFILLALASGAAMYPVARRQRNQDPALVSNVDALIGKEARTLEEISGESLGLIRFDNSNWTARPVEGQPTIAANTPVKVVSIAGATAIVEPLEPTSTPDA